MELLGKRAPYCKGQLHAVCVQRVKASFKLQSERVGITVSNLWGFDSDKWI